MKEILKQNKIKSLLVSNAANIFYLTGFRAASPNDREAFVLINQKQIFLLTYAIYQEEARKASMERDVESIIIKEKDTFRNLLKKEGGEIVGFEEEDLSVAEFEKLKKYGCKMQPTNGLVEKLRMVKNEEELGKIRKAVEITDRVYEEVLSELKSGLTEIQIARMIESKIFEFGGDDIAFKPIVAFSDHSALPHHYPDRTKIGEGMLLIDMGAKVEGYCADLTRTIYLGKPDKKFKELNYLVKRAQEAAIKVITPGLKASEVDETAREELGEYEKYFITSTGHGVGLNIHENPHLSPHSDEILQPGMIVTVEPGVYIPGWGGIRIEDYGLVTDQGLEVLSKAS